VVPRVVMAASHEWRRPDRWCAPATCCCKRSSLARGVTLRAVATSLEIPVNSGRVRAECEIDFRGALAVSHDASVGFTAIPLSCELDTDVTAEQLDMLKLTGRYCVVYQTLAEHPRCPPGSPRHS
jgi:OsmC-like protein